MIPDMPLCFLCSKPLPDDEFDSDICGDCFDRLRDSQKEQEAINDYDEGSNRGGESC